jgi:hypothetical protein
MVFVANPLAAELLALVREAQSETHRLSGRPFCFQLVAFGT